MKTARFPLSRIERSVFGVSFAIIALVYVVGTSARIPWGHDPIPLLAVLNSLQFKAVLNLQSNGGWLIALVGAGLLGWRYATMARWEARVLSLISVLLISIFILSDLLGSLWNAIGLIAFAVPMSLQATLGFADGEFYVEGLLKYSAAGLWLVLCICFLIREVVWRVRNRALTEPNAPPNGGRAEPLGNSGVTEGPPSVS